jgi:hypothetical protein
MLRIMKYIPTGQASRAAKLRAPLAIAPKDKPNNETAAKSKSGAPQQIAIQPAPLSHRFPCIEHAADPVSFFATSVDCSTEIPLSAAVSFSAVSAVKGWSDMNNGSVSGYCFLGRS